jgi:sec-independent protein translocase protein TatA
VADSSLLSGAFILPNLGPWEILVILLVALLVFGGRLPEVGRSLGKTITQFRRGLRDLQDEIEHNEPPEPPRPRLRAPKPPPAENPPTEAPPSDAS